MNNVIKFNPEAGRSRVGAHSAACPLLSCGCRDTATTRSHKTASDIEATLHMEQILAELDGRTSWMKDLDTIPEHLRTGNHETDVIGIALGMDKLAGDVMVALGAFEIAADFFGRQVATLSDAQRARVLEHIGKDTATALLLLAYRDKLKAAELAPMVDKVLRARG